MSRVLSRSFLSRLRPGMPTPSDGKLPLCVIADGGRIKPCTIVLIKETNLKDLEILKDFSSSCNSRIGTKAILICWHRVSFKGLLENFLTMGIRHSSAGARSQRKSWQHCRSNLLDEEEPDKRIFHPQKKSDGEFSMRKIRVRICMQQPPFRSFKFSEISKKIDSLT